MQNYASRLCTHNRICMALRTIAPSWPFAIWGPNAVGPFRTALGGYKHILVVVDKFTKWIEVRPIAKVTLEEAVKFIGDIKHRSVCLTGSSPT
jgi:hypothetical protein